MKNFKKITSCVTGGLAWCLVAHASEPAQATNPYAAIAARNIFNLESPPPQPPVALPVELPPKLVPDGIINLFGRTQVLFKVEVPQNSSHTQSQSSSYIMSEGEQRDAIQVMHIDVINGVVTFNNHGTVQRIPLVKSAVNASEIRTLPTPTQILFNPSRQSG